MPTIADAEDSYLAGRARFESWREQFEKQWYAPLGEMMFQMLLANMTPEQRVQLQTMAQQQLTQKQGGPNA